MYITGTDTPRELSNQCCEDGQNLIVMDCQFLKASLVECDDKKLDLADLGIKISTADAYSRTLAANATLLVNIDESGVFKFLATKVDENKSVLYRFIDPYSDNLETVNYSYNVDIITGDVTGNSCIPVIINVELLPDNTTISPTWESMYNTHIFSSTISSWIQNNLSWYDIEAANVSNSLHFPEIELSNFEANLYRDDDGNFSNTIIVKCPSTDGLITFQFKIYINFVYSTSILTYEIQSVELIGGEFYGPMIDDASSTAASTASGYFNIAGSGFANIGFQNGDQFSINGTIIEIGDDVAIGASDQATATNLINFINNDPDLSGIVVASHDYANGANGGGKITITSVATGSDANLLIIAVEDGNHTSSGATLSGALDAHLHKSYSVASNIYTINFNGYFRSIFIKRYHTLESLMVLSGGDLLRLPKIEFWNNSTGSRKLCFMGAI